MINKTPLDIKTNIPASNRSVNKSEFIELKCFVCGKMAGCRECSFSNTCNRIVAQLCICETCLNPNDKEEGAFKNYQQVFIRKAFGQDDGGEWKAIFNGLPEAEGTIIAILAANPKNNGEFYAINNRGLFCSTDAGLAWRELDLTWSKEYLLQHPCALAIRGQDQQLRRIIV